MSPQKESHKKVSERNTKQELWTAYNELVQEIGQEPVKIQLEQKEIAPSDSLKNLSELKLAIGQQLDSAGEELLKDLNALQETKNKINKEKRRLIEYLDEQKRLLESEIAAVKSRWEKERKLHEEQIEEEFRQKGLEKRRQEDEYDYHLESQRRQEDDKIAQERAEQEKKLKEQEEVLTLQEQEITKKAAKIAQEVNLTKEILTKELTARHNAELREAKLDFERDRKIYELKITNLETRVKSQNEEIAKLQNQLAKASEQVKDIAVSVIEGRSLKTPSEQSEEKEK